MEKNIIDFLVKKHPNYKDLIFSIRYRLLSKVYERGDYTTENKFPLQLKKLFFILKIFRNILFLFGNSIIYKKKDVPLYKGLSFTYFNYDKLWEEEKNIIYRFFPYPKRVSEYIPWSLKLFFKYARLDYAFNFRSFYFLSSPSFFDLIEDYNRCLCHFLDEWNYDYFLLPNDLDFHPRLLIKYSNLRGKPTFIIAHGGMPHLYDGTIDNLSTYVSMWGDKQISGYLYNSYNPDKFFKTGHPFYKVDKVDLKFSLDNILVLTKSMNNVCPLEKIMIDDPGMCLQYLYSIQNALESIGIMQVRLRLHPSENEKWYKRFINLNFFKFDNLDLVSSLASTSAVIGPVSTVFIDAILNNRNYTVYEPTIENKTIYGYTVQPPLDGIDKRIPVARSEAELIEILTNRRGICPTVVSEFGGIPFDMDILFRILESHNNN